MSRIRCTNHIEYVPLENIFWLQLVYKDKKKVRKVEYLKIPNTINLHLTISNFPTSYVKEKKKGSIQWQNKISKNSINMK